MAGNNSAFVAVDINRTTCSLERWLAKLKKENKIEFRGPDKTGGYFIK